MNKKQLLNAVNKHPKFETNRLIELTGNKATTNAVLFQYLCELEHWLPLEVKSTKHKDWFTVASTSEIGEWHHCSIAQQSCDCRHGGSNNKQCCHLAALDKYLEDSWIRIANKYGFTVVFSDSRYEIFEHSKQVACLLQRDGNWWLDTDDVFIIESPEKAIEHLVAVASFGWQYGT
jgi:hypothetical protein